MSCYTRHLKSIFAEAGVTDTTTNHQAADRVLRDRLGMQHARCSEVWRELRHWLAQPSTRALVIEDLHDHFRSVAVR